MTQTFEFYNARAEEAAAEAKAATLDNVRDRNLRAEKTWRGLANQARRVLLDRQKTEAAKVRKREEDAAEIEARANAWQDGNGANDPAPANDDGVDAAADPRLDLNPSKHLP